jgi:hypothetical protein
MSLKQPKQPHHKSGTFSVGTFGTFSIGFYMFDRKAKKIAARYQQVFGTRRMVARIKERRADGGREGGVIWHTTGSGKSFSMLFLCKALLFHSDLASCRVLVVTDRKDLEKQLSGTFISGGAFGGVIEDFYEALTEFGMRLKLALESPSFFESVLPGESDQSL